MRFIVDNVKTTIVIGGTDNLINVDILKKLREYMKIRPDGYHRVPSYQDGKWDGWKHFMTPKGAFLTGFLSMVISFVQEYGYTVVIEDNRGNIPVLKDVIDPVIGMVDGVLWTGRDYQIQAVESLRNTITVSDGQTFYFPRGILDCATNAGKNSMAALVLKNLKSERNKIFLVSSSLIYKQAVDFFSQVLDEDIGEVKSGKFAPKKFTICMVRTLFNRAKESINVRKWLLDTDLVIVDESDEVGAKEYSKVLGYVGAGMRLFMSGTPLSAGSVNNMNAIGLSGPVLFKISNKYLIDKGHSQKPEVIIILNNSGSKPFESYDAEMERIIHLSSNRINKIANTILKHLNSKILITFIKIHHGQYMFDKLNTMFPNKTAFAHGTVKNKEDVLESFFSGDKTILLSSMIIKRGVNANVIRVIIQAQGGKSVSTVKQIGGRGLRHDGKNDGMFMYDFYDCGKYVGEHSRKRIKIYKEEEFDVEYDYERHRNKPIL